MTFSIFFVLSCIFRKNSNIKSRCVTLIRKIFQMKRSFFSFQLFKNLRNLRNFHGSDIISKAHTEGAIVGATETT